MTGTITESRSLIQLPCGYENNVRSGAADMYVRMHRKGCKICSTSKAIAHVTELQTAGTKSDAASLGEAKRMAGELAANAGIELPEDIDSILADKIAQAKRDASKR